MENKDAIVTVLTPTYNRCNILHNLYESLCIQTNQEFEWLIVDDGSNDGTGDLINNWIKEDKIKIRYIFKNNGGKHTALNKGIQTIEAQFTFIVDSDDRLTEDAIETVVNKINILSNSKICGMAFLRIRENGEYLTNKLVPVDGFIESFVRCRYYRNITGDMAEVWKTEILKRFPFPEFSGEKFLSEDVVWVQMSEYYDMVFFNKAIYISDYLEGGLTKGRRKHNWYSPNGSMHRGEVHLKSNLPFKFKIRAMLYFLVYGKVAGFSNMALIKKTKFRGMALLLLIPSNILYLKWKREF